MVLFMPMLPTAVEAASFKDAKDTLSGMNTTVLTAAVAASGTVISVSDTTGFVASDEITINDGTNDEIATISSIDATAKTITVDAALTNGYDVNTRIIELSDITHTITFINETAIPDFRSMDLIFDSNFSTDNGSTTNATIANVSGLPTAEGWALTGQGTLTLTYSSSTGATLLAADTSISFQITSMLRQPDGTTASEYSIEIKLKDEDGDVIDTATVYYSINPGVEVSAIVAESLTMTITGTATGDITTTAYTVPFATVSDGTAVTGVMQVTIASNAADGYSLLIEGDSKLTSADGDNIAPATTTGASPDTWPTVDSNTTSAYGYTISDADAGGGDWSSKYAAFSTTTAYEVGDNSGPTAGTTNDAGGLHTVTLKVEIDTMHPAGDYYGSIVFSVTPTF